MKSKLILLIFAALIFVSVRSVLAEEQKIYSSVPNPSFESWGKSAPTGWQIEGSQNPSNDIVWSTQPQSGTYSLRFSSTNGYLTMLESSRFNQNYKSNGQYRIQVYAKTTPQNPGSFNLQVYEEGGSPVDKPLCNLAVSPTSDWQAYSKICDLKIPAKQGAGFFYLILRTTSSKVYLDNITLK